MPTLFGTVFFAESPTGRRKDWFFKTARRCDLDKCSECGDPCVRDEKLCPACEMHEQEKMTPPRPREWFLDLEADPYDGELQVHHERMGKNMVHVLESSPAREAAEELVEVVRWAAEHAPTLTKRKEWLALLEKAGGAGG